MDIKNNNELWHFSLVRPHAPKRLSLFTLELTQQCNFRCKYCCFSGNYKDRRKHNSLTMSYATMHQTLKFILDNRCPDRLTIVTFYGGEALLALDKIKWMISKLRTELGADVGFSISSNGYVLTPKVTDWLCTIDDCMIYITIDGFEELHDANRRTVSDKPTYKTILNNLKYFKARYPYEYESRVNFLVTLKQWNQLPLVSDKWKNNNFFKGKLPKHLSFILPKNIDEMANIVSPLEERRDVLETAFNRYKEGEDSLLTHQFIEWTDNIYRGLQCIQDCSEITIKTCIEDMYRTFINARGDIYVCERFCSEYNIGNVNKEGLDEGKLIELEETYIKRRNKICVNCNAAPLCRMCMLILNYNDEELNALCKTERLMVELIKEYAWKRRMYDRKKMLVE